MHVGAFGQTHKRLESNPVLTLNLFANLKWRTNSIFFSKELSDELKMIMNSNSKESEEVKRNYDSLFFEDDEEEYNKMVNEALQINIQKEFDIQQSGIQAEYDTWMQQYRVTFKKVSRRMINLLTLLRQENGCF